MTLVRFRAKFCSYLMILFASASIVPAATHIVDDDGVQCAGAPFTTITAALAAANPTGDTIQVCDGTYAEGTIVVAKEVIIDGVNRDATFVNVTASTTFGFHVTADNVTISDLTIQEVGGGAVTGANGIRYESPTAMDNEVVSNVVIRDFLDGSARGIEVHDATMNDFTVTNSTFSNNLYGIRLSSNSHVDGLALTGSTFSAVTNGNDFSRVGLYQANDAATSTFRDLQASGNTFTNLSLGGFFLEELQDSVIGPSNQFNGNYTGVIINKTHLNSGTPVSGVEISGNTFTNQTGRAVFLAAHQVGLGAGVEITGNTINVGAGSMIAGNRGAITTNLQTTLVHQPLTISDNDVTFSGTFGSSTTASGVHLVGDGPVVITGNTFDGGGVASSGTPPLAAIYLQTNSTSPALGARNDAVTFTCNDVTAFVHGITVYDPVTAQAGNLLVGTSVDVHANNIAGNSLFGIFNSATDGASETIDADGNWWGSPSGPGGAGPGTGDAISENVSAPTFLSGPQTNCAALSITKESFPNPVPAGGQVTYTITVTNAGVGPANGVVVNDTLPAALSNVVTSGCLEDPNGGSVCTLGSIAGGASDFYTLTATVSINATGTIVNTASVSASGIPAAAADDTANEPTDVLGASVVEIPTAGSAGLLVLGLLLALAGGWVVSRGGR